MDLTPRHLPSLYPWHRPEEMLRISSGFPHSSLRYASGKNAIVHLYIISADTGDTHAGTTTRACDGIARHAGASGGRYRARLPAHPGVVFWDYRRRRATQA